MTWKRCKTQQIPMCLLTNEFTLHTTCRSWERIHSAYNMQELGESLNKLAERNLEAMKAAIQPLKTSELY